MKVLTASISVSKCGGFVCYIKFKSYALIHFPRFHWSRLLLTLFLCFEINIWQNTLHNSSEELFTYFTEFYDRFHYLWLNSFFSCVGIWTFFYAMDDFWEHLKWLFVRIRIVLFIKTTLKDIDFEIMLKGKTSTNSMKWSWLLNFRREPTYTRILNFDFTNRRAPSAENQLKLESKFAFQHRAYKLIIRIYSLQHKIWKWNGW